MVLGGGIKMNRVLALGKKTLVGQVQGDRFSIQTLKDWVDNDIDMLVQLLSVVDQLAKGWIHLKFAKAKDAKLIKE